MSILSGQITRPPFDVIVNSNYPCLPTAYRWYFSYYFVSPFTLIGSLSTITPSSSTPTIMTTATMTAAAAFVRRGQCQHAHYRYVHTHTHNTHWIRFIVVVVSLFFFFFWLSKVLFSASIFSFARCLSPHMKKQQFKILYFFVCVLVSSLLLLCRVLINWAHITLETCFGYRQSTFYVNHSISIFLFLDLFFHVHFVHCLHTNMLIDSTVWWLVKVRFFNLIQKKIDCQVNGEYLHIEIQSK